MATSDKVSNLRHVTSRDAQIPRGTRGRFLSWTSLSKQPATWKRKHKRNF